MGCQIDALQLGMDHFSRQLSARIIIIKKVCLQKVPVLPRHLSLIPSAVGRDKLY